MFPNWFEGYAKNYFKKYLTGLEGNALQIGAYTGDASVWLSENTKFNLVDVDTWAGSNEAAHESIDFEAVYQYYRSRTRNLNYRGTSDEFFNMLPLSLIYPQKYDFIYIDGSHETEQVLRDAVNAEQHLKSGGLLAFDDFLWGRGRNVPMPAIKAFMRCYELKFDVLEKGLQVWLQKH